MSTIQKFSSKSFEVEELREALESVIAVKGQHYSILATMSLRFGADNTQARRDFFGFCNINSNCNKREFTREGVEPDDNMPGRTFTRKLFTLSENIGQCAGRFPFFIMQGMESLTVPQCGPVISNVIAGNNS